MSCFGLMSGTRNLELFLNKKKEVRDSKMDSTLNFIKNQSTRLNYRTLNGLYMTSPYIIP